MEILKIILALSVGLGVVHSYETGAADEACESLTPGHGSQNTGASPYKIDIMGDWTSYFPGGPPIHVKLSGSQKYTGMLLQARNVGSTTPLGNFNSKMDSNAKLMKCTADDDSVTHTSSADKNDLIFEWKPPTTATGEVEFVATFAETKDNWWSNIKSAKLTQSSVDPGPGPGPGGMPPRTTTDPTSVGTKASSNHVMLLFVAMTIFLISTKHI